MGFCTADNRLAASSTSDQKGKAQGTVTKGGPRPWWLQGRAALEGEGQRDNIWWVEGGNPKVDLP